MEGIVAENRPPVFMSYGREAETLAHDLRTGLERRGLAVSDDRLVEPSDRWAEAIERTILDASLVLLLISPGFLASPSANFEARIAIAQRTAGRRVVPVLTRGITPNALPYPLKPLQMVVAAGLDGDDILTRLDPVLPATPKVGSRVFRAAEHGGEATILAPRRTIPRKS